MSKKLPVYTTLICARCASASYGNAEELNFVQALNGPTTNFDKLTNGAFAQVSSGPFGVVIAFRGTNITEATDLLADVLALPVNGFHSGFSSYVNFLAGDIEAWLDNITARTTPNIFLTGHSMGGAMAQIYAFKILEKYRIVPHVFAFDSPACLSSERSSFFNNYFTSSWRVYIKGDPIVRVLNALFTHTSQMVEVSPEGYLSYTVSSIFQTSFSHSIDTLITYLKRTQGAYFYFSFL